MHAFGKMTLLGAKLAPLNSVDDDSDEGSGKSKSRPPMLTKALSVMSSRNVNHAVAPGRIDGSSNLGAFATKEEISLGKMVEYVSSFFPGTFSNHRLSDRFWTELMNHQMINHRIWRYDDPPVIGDLMTRVTSTPHCPILPELNLRRLNT